MIDGLVDHDDTQRLSDIGAPTMLLWGDRDALFPRTDQERLLAGAHRATRGLRRDGPLPELGATRSGRARHRGVR
jgi:pimeloyl-ACP methyl ester carboxylesterase